LDIQKNENYREVLTWDQSAIFIVDFWNSKNINSALNIYLNQTTPSKQYLPTSSLTESFRFGPNLASVLDAFVYEEGFKSKKSENTEIIICNVANPQASRGRGRLNEAEAITIQNLVSQNFKVTDSVAVLAPYRDQIKELKKRLSEFKDENKILTVHKSQGREWDTVIYSVCDVGNGRAPWFTDSTSTLSNGLNNVNTAVSRAKKRLIICCNKNEWSNRKDQLIKGLLDAATREINYDSSKFTFTSANRHYTPRTNSMSYDNSTNTAGTSNINKIKGKDYVPQKADEEWESKTLYWSKLKKSGYIYSKKKDAWWKKK
jgi:superfamily I DNA/RNA helicase